jgi:hypothetical protein
MKFFALLIASLMLSLDSLGSSFNEIKFKDQDFEVQVLSYRPEKPKSFILIVPPSGGTNYIDRSYASGLRQRGHHVYVLSRWTGDDEYNLDLEIHKRFYARSFRAIGLVLSQIPKNAKVGILGTSVGGLHASIAASRYPEISSAMIITAGAHISSIIAHSDQEAMISAWLKRKKLYGFKDRFEYEEALNKVIELEALDRAQIKTQKKFGLVISSTDTTVPTINQERLKSLWKPEKVMYKNKDHFWTIVLTWLFDADFIYDFFE